MFLNSSLKSTFPCHFQFEIKVAMPDSQARDRQVKSSDYSVLHYMNVKTGLTANASGTPQATYNRI
jgi:hypothetical protein